MCAGLSLGSRVFGGGGIAGEPCDPPVATEADVIASKVVGRGPAYMLSVGQYPPFTRFPKFVVDFQLKERERIVAEEEALRRMASAAEIVGKRKYGRLYGLGRLLYLWLRAVLS